MGEAFFPGITQWKPISLSHPPMQTFRAHWYVMLGTTSNCWTLDTCATAISRLSTRVRSYFFCLFICHELRVKNARLGTKKSMIGQCRRQDNVAYGRSGCNNEE